MAKIDYTKVEQSLQEGLIKMQIASLLRLADIASALGSQPKKGASPGLDPAVIKALKKLHLEIKQIRKNDPALYEKLGLTPDEIKRLFESPNNLTPADWEILKTIYEKIGQFKAELHGKLTPESDQEIIEKQRKKQKNERYNVNRNWLPLK